MYRKTTFRHYRKRPSQENPVLPDVHACPDREEWEIIEIYFRVWRRKSYTRQESTANTIEKKKRREKAANWLLIVSILIGQDRGGIEHGTIGLIIDQSERCSQVCSSAGYGTEESTNWMYNSRASCTLCSRTKMLPRAKERERGERRRRKTSAKYRGKLVPLFIAFG